MRFSVSRPKKKKKLTSDPAVLTETVERLRVQEEEVPAPAVGLAMDVA
jgi:hypothetical protein